MAKRVQGYGELFKSYPDVVDVVTLCEMLGGISKKYAYRLLQQGQIRSIKIGRSYRIPKTFVAAYLLGQNENRGWISHRECGSVCAADGGPPDTAGVAGAATSQTPKGKTS